MKPTKKKKALWLNLAQRGRCRIPNGGLKQAKVRKRIRPITSALAKQRRIYAKASKAFLVKHPFCQVYPWLPSSEVHHKFGRVGKRLLDESGWMALSHTAHLEIHSDIRWARERGYICEKGKWNAELDDI